MEWFHLPSTRHSFYLEFLLRIGATPKPTIQYPNAPVRRRAIRRRSVYISGTPGISRGFLASEHVHDQADKHVFVLGIGLGDEEGERGQADVVDHRLAVLEEAAIAV